MKTNFKAIAFALILLSLPIGTAYGAIAPTAPGKKPTTPTATLTSAKSTAVEITIPSGQETTIVKGNLPAMVAAVTKATNQLANVKRGCYLDYQQRIDKWIVCDSVCFFGRLWKYTPQDLKIKAARSCGCYCAYRNAHPKAFEALKEYIPKEQLEREYKSSGYLAYYMQE
jgi:hypothetical protein